MLISERKGLYNTDEDWIWNLISFCMNTSFPFFDNAFSSEQLEEKNFHVLLLLYFEAPENQCNSIKDKELIEIILSDDLEHLMHINTSTKWRSEGAEGNIHGRTAV